MKQKFDWLREQVRERLGNVNFEKSTKEVNESFYNGMAYSYGEMETLINEAEAKWEAEHCCECENCGTKVEMDSNGDYACVRCGRNTARLRELEEEKDCCEWKFEKNTGLVWHCEDECESYNISYQRDLEIFLEEFECKCPHCGKRIKILEVEQMRRLIDADFLMEKLLRMQKNK